MASHVAEALEERKSEEAVLRLPLLSPPTAAAILEPPSTVEPWSPPSAFETSQPPSRTWKQPFCGE